MKQSEPVNILLIENNAEHLKRVDVDFLIPWLEEGNSSYHVRKLLLSDYTEISLDQINAQCALLNFYLSDQTDNDPWLTISQLSSHLPVVLLIGEDEESLALTGIQHGAGDYLIRDALSQARVLTTVRNVLKTTLLEKKQCAQVKERRQFLKVFTHDLKAPLRQISQFNEMLAESIDSNDIDDAKQLMAVQSETANRAYKLITMLADYSVLDKDVPRQPVSLTDIVEIAAENSLNERNHQHASISINPLFDVYGNDNQLMALFQILFANSMTYNASAVPEIIVKRDPSQKNTVLITDNGLGIEEEHLEAIFLPMRRLWGVNSRYAGVGLGLSIARKTLDLHGGKIWCTSVPKQGTTMHVWIPELQNQRDKSSKF